MLKGRGGKRLLLLLRRRRRRSRGSKWVLRRLWLIGKVGMGGEGPECLLPPVPSSLLQPPAPFMALLLCIGISTLPPLLLLLLAIGGWDLT